MKEDNMDGKCDLCGEMECEKYKEESVTLE